MNKGLRVTILGSGTCVPSLERSSCSVLMETGKVSMLFDIGPGTMHRLLEAGSRVTGIDFLFISHFHPDHTGELASFLFANKSPNPQARKKKLTIAGGPGFADFYENLARTWPHWLDLGQNSVITEIDPETGKQVSDNDEGFNISFAPAPHQPESIAFRVQAGNGQSVVYTGDTDFCREIVELAKNADILICECALPDNIKVEGHMTPALAGKTATEARAGCLVLTHFYPECEKADIEGQCRKTYSGPIYLARDLMSFDLSGNKAGI
ncbi:MAG: ribonuclease Z [Desulfobacteraceae bacterium]|nr:ribonuclease Z [Desulfobacteraceae bacterium]